MCGEFVVDYFDDFYYWYWVEEMVVCDVLWVFVCCGYGCDGE